MTPTQKEIDQIRHDLMSENGKKSHAKMKKKLGMKGYRADQKRRRNTRNGKKK